MGHAWKRSCRLLAKRLNGRFGSVNRHNPKASVPQARFQVEQNQWLVFYDQNQPCFFRGEMHPYIRRLNAQPPP